MTSSVKGGRAQRLVIGPDDTLLDVFDRVRAGGTGPVELTIPNESPLFLTAAEFRTLRDVADHGRHAVTIRTPDPLRVQLAKLFGLDVAPAPVPPPRAAKPVPSVIPASAAPPALTAPAAGGSVAGPPTTPAPSQPAAPAAAEAASTISEHEAVARWPAEPVVHPPVPSAPRRLLDRISAAAAARRPPAPMLAATPEAAVTEPRAEEAPAEAARPPDTETEAEAATPRRLPWISDRLRVSPLVLIGVALFGLLLIVTSVNFLLPSAVVTLELASVPLGSELLFDVTEDGQPLDDAAAFALTGTPATVTVMFEGSVPTTGMESIPDGVAAGTLRLANPTAAELTAAAGSVVTTESGAEFRVVEAVLVPPADAATGAPGQAEGAIEAVAPGTGGNVATGEIGGRLPNGLYFSNRESPTAGGSDREVQTVALADLDALRQQAEASLSGLVEAALAADEASAAAEPGIVAPTLTVLERADTFDQAVGAASDNLGLRAERTVSVLAYDRAAAADSLAGAFGGQLRSTLPEGYRLGPIVLAADDVTLVAGSLEGARLRVDAAAEAGLALSDDKRAELANLLAGKSEAEAAAILDGMPEIARFEVEPGFRLFSRGMPANAGRIEIDDGAGR